MVDIGTGHQFPISGYSDGCTEYHILESEPGWCSSCRSVQFGVGAETPADLDTIKERMRVQYAD